MPLQLMHILADFDVSSVNKHRNSPEQLSKYDTTYAFPLKKCYGASCVPVTGTLAPNQMPSVSER